MGSTNSRIPDATLPETTTLHPHPTLEIQVKRTNLRDRGTYKEIHRSLEQPPANTERNQITDQVQEKPTTLFTGETKQRTKLKKTSANLRTKEESQCASLPRRSPPRSDLGP